MARPERRVILRWADKLGRLPSELLASVTSVDIIERMAWERIEPSGSLHDEFMFGQLCATLANINRDPENKREPWRPRDFMPALDRAISDRETDDAPIFLDDPEAMSALIKSRIFRIS